MNLTSGSSLSDAVNGKGKGKEKERTSVESGAASVAGEGADGGKKFQISLFIDSEMRKAFFNMKIDRNVELRELYVEALKEYIERHSK